MSGSVIIILVHQTIFQGMFFAKNISLGRRLRGADPGEEPRGHSVGRIYCCVHRYFSFAWSVRNLFWSL